MIEVEQQNNRTVFVAVVTGCVVLLLGLCVGAMAGGIAGYTVGGSFVASTTQRFLQPERVFPVLPEAPETPEFRGVVPPGMAGMTGAWVQKVTANSSADEAGVQPGDLIISVDDTPVDANHRLLELIRNYKPGDKISLTVWRLGQTSALAVELGKSPSDPGRAYLGIEYVEAGMPQAQPGD